MKFLVLLNSDLQIPFTPVTCQVAEQEDLPFTVFFVNENSIVFSETTSNLILFGTSMATYLTAWIILECVTWNLWPAWKENGKKPQILSLYITLFCFARHPLTLISRASIFSTQRVTYESFSLQAAPLPHAVSYISANYKTQACRIMTACSHVT